MNNRQQGSGGALFSRQKKTEKGPDMGGDITIEGDLLNYILDRARSGSVKIELSAWRRHSNNGSTFLSLSANIPYEERKGGQDRQMDRQPERQNYRDQQAQGTYRSGYGQPNPNHSTQLGGSQRDYDNRYSGRGGPRNVLDDI